MGSSFSSPFDFKHPTLPDDAALRVIRTLTVNCPCLAEWQLLNCVKLHLPRNDPRRRVSKHEFRPLLSTLVAAGYLGMREVPFVAPATISAEPLFAEDGLYYEPPANSDADFDHIAMATQTRVPELSEHGSKRIYFATVAAAELIRSHGLFAPFPESGLPKNQQRRIELVDSLVASHPRGLEKMPPSPPELSCSDLTAVINLGELLFLDAFMEKVESRQCVYSVAVTSEERRVYGRMERADGSGTFIALLFLGSISPLQLRDRLKEHCFDSGDWPSRLWWM